MKTKTSILIISAVIAMLLLALISTGLSAYQSLGMTRGFTPGNGQFPESMPDLRDFPSGEGMAIPPSFDGNPPDGSGQTMPFGGDANGQRDGTAGFPGGRQGMAGFGILRYIGLGLNVLGLVLAVVAAIFLLKGKKWAGILALVWAGVMLVVNVFGLFTSRGTLSTVVRIACILLAIGIYVLLLLKKSRAIWSAPKQLELEEDEDDDDDEDYGIAAPQIPASSQPSNAETASSLPAAGVQKPLQKNNDADNDDDDD